MSVNLGRRLWSIAQWTSRAGKFVPIFLFFATMLSWNCLGQATVVWKEGFELDEDPWERWHVEGAVWAVGTPTSGPQRAFAGTQCAATVLNGNYPPGADARFVRDRVFTVPPATEQPRLRFWHWFRGAPGSTRTIEVKVGAGEWQAVEVASGWSNEDWGRALVDLTPFSGQSVQIAFHLQAGPEKEVAAGWYVDDVVVETGPTGDDLISSVEGFEAGLGNWVISQRGWEVGQATEGPGFAFGRNCAGTVLGGFYQPATDSRLISPEFVVPSVSQNPRLAFWHWFSIFQGDPARVEISAGGGAWVPLSPLYDGNSPWTRALLDLRPFAGQSVQIAFHFQSNEDFNIAAGWYVDEVTVDTGPVDWDPVNDPEGFETARRPWAAERGVWQFGPPGLGPASPPSGSSCAGTSLDEGYQPNTDSRLISPEFTVPAAGETPRLRFWQWLRNHPGDPASVEIRTVGGDWQVLVSGLMARDGSWAPFSIDLSAFAGQRVQVAFRFQANEDNKVGIGWLIDEIAVEVGISPGTLVDQPQTFETGFGAWSVDRGSWEVGQPDAWPDRAVSGVRCAGTAVIDNYSPDTDSRFSSPEFTVPQAVENPRLRFWHWFSILPGDKGTVEISVEGGPWQPLTTLFSGNGVVWTRPSLDLRPFAGKPVRVGFHFESNSDGDVGRGWYLDDVVVETGLANLETFNASEGFESGLGNWMVENGTWEAGPPGSGPGETFKGTNVVATVLRFNFGKYAANTDSRLASPPFSVPCADAVPALRFAHWYSIAEGDEGVVELREEGGEWQPVLGPISGSSLAWTAGYVDLAPFAGKTVQVGFRFRSNGDSEVSTGWYLDEIKLQASVLQTVGDTTVVEGTLFAYSFSSPCQSLRFTLGPGAPPGMSIDQALGILVWLPSEEHGPGVFPVQVCATDANDVSKMLDCLTLRITVLETNAAPGIDPIEPKSIEGGVPLEFDVTAFDPDRPAQKLRFSLDQGAPFGATLDPDTGRFSWTPTATQATVQAIVTVRVTDDGNPPKSAVASFVAGPSGPVSTLRLVVKRLTPELITICLEGGEVGGIYTLETCTDLSPDGGLQEWTPLQTFWKGEDPICETTHSTVTSNRYYRVRRAQ